MLSPCPPRRELRDAYRFPDFTPSRTVVAIFGDPRARVITLTRREVLRDEVSFLFEREEAC